MVKKTRTTKQIGTSDLANGVLVNLGVVVAYVLSYGFVTFAILPLQSMFLPELSKSVCLVFLPSGVKMFAILAFGEVILPAMLIASLFCDHFFWGIENLNLLTAVTACGIGVYYLVIEISSKLGVDIYLPDDFSKIPNPRQILLLGMFASSLNGILSSAILADLTPYQNGGVVAMLYLLGDTLGILVFTAIVWLVLKIV